MIQTLYLAECSKTYRQWIPRLLKGYVRECVDLWDSPDMSLVLDPGNLLMVDEAFLSKGPGPICTVMASLLEPRRIVTLPILVLRRREATLRELSPRVLQLRRPFFSSELAAVLSHFCPKGRILEEVNMSEDSYSNSGRTGDPVAGERVTGDQPVAPTIDAATLEKITREAIEKVVREMIPPMAEKIVREEIERLTS